MTVCGRRKFAEDGNFQNAEVLNFAEEIGRKRQKWQFAEDGNIHKTEICERRKYLMLRKESEDGSE